jgi:exosome complex exonuclease RRP6
MQQFGHRLLSLNQAFLQHSKSLAPQAQPVSVPLLTELEDSEEVLEQFESIVDVVDSLLESVDTWTDEAKGTTNTSKIVVSQAKISGSGKLGGGRNTLYGSASGNQFYSPAWMDSYNIFTASNIPRVQLSFEDAPIDNSNTPFRPKITNKPNALLPLSYYFTLSSLCNLHCRCTTVFIS